MWRNKSPITRVTRNHTKSPVEAPKNPVHIQTIVCERNLPTQDNGVMCFFSLGKGLSYSLSCQSVSLSCIYFRSQAFCVHIFFETNKQNIVINKKHILFLLFVFPGSHFFGYLVALVIFFFSFLLLEMPVAAFAAMAIVQVPTVQTQYWINLSPKERKKSHYVSCVSCINLALKRNASAKKHFWVWCTWVRCYKLSGCFKCQRINQIKHYQ